MDEETLNKRLQQLIEEIANLPSDTQKQLAPLVEETKRRHSEIKENANRLTKSLTDLQLCLKYLLFDLEATRRERDKFKNMLDHQPPQNTDDESNAY